VSTSGGATAAPARTLALAVGDPAEGRALSAMFREPEYRVYRVENAAEFRLLLRNTIPDLAVLDWKLPDEEGFDLCRELREDPRTRRLSLLVILPPQGTTLEECFVSGVNDFISRPLEAAEVVRKIDRLSRVPDRKRLHTLALVRPETSESSLLGRAINVSRTGILVELDTPLSIGAACEIRFNLPGQSEPVRARGVVRRRARESGATAFGVEFGALAPEDRTRLHRFFGETKPSWRPS
jgi:CheY-like chemotaxis protein